jgi:hypothetical protein
MFKQLLFLTFAVFCFFLAKSTVDSQVPAPAGTLADLSAQILTTVRSFNATVVDKHQLNRQLHNQTWNSVQLMKRNNVKLTADDITRTTDGLKNQLASDANSALKGDELNAFIGRLKEKLTKNLSRK